MSKKRCCLKCKEKKDCSNKCILAIYYPDIMEFDDEEDFCKEYPCSMFFCPHTKQISRWRSHPKQQQQLDTYIHKN